ncbi:putative Arp2/3 protein complex subunit sop2 [Leucosporidium creatinivorum]|uniref:Actin-related protein 2/3 complex subunit n=1 Tax=Leucosporidium creatinivorum TaxID=106004 RepID=A0A1Y2G3C8_9BASI|nr:putative Arp2/3 protein complex subunit sop2 [Leucosporidium creatinivorum]
MSEILSAVIGTPITAHAFNGDRTQLAISPNTNEVHIYAKSGAGWQLAHTLTEHDKLVTSIDWAPQTNRIVTCSHDRNAYVWNYVSDPETGAPTWLPTLVLLRLNRSATFVRWSPNEEKFAVASGARTIAVCQFDQESDWWVAKHIKKPLRTTVLSLDWHPNSVLLAAGSADGMARVFSAFMKGVDAKPTPTVWGERLPFNTVCGEFASPSGGWVHGVAFSPSGDALAFAGHDSTITVVYPSGPETAPHAVYPIQLPALPAVSLVFISENAFVAAGHDCQPVLFEGSIDQGWAQVRSLDDHEKREGAGAGRAAGGVGRLNNSEAFNRFRSADSRGVAGGAAAPAVAGTRLTATGTELLTLHQNTITSVRAFEGGLGGQEVSQVSTTGVDGRVVVWSTAGGVGGVTQGVGRLGL